MHRELIIIINDIRSTHNVGSIFRTAEGLGVNKLIISGYSPYPLEKNDVRLPHISRKIDMQINKTALGAQNNIEWKHEDSNILDIILRLKETGYQVVALEQDEKSQNLTNIQIKNKIALILGNEVSGIDSSILNECDQIAEIAMPGKKESLNVSCATAIAIYRLLFLP